MSKSMTGYGKATGETEGRRIVAEIRSVNSKSLDLSVKLPSIYRPLEYDIRSLGASIVRGKCDIFITIENSLTSGGNINDTLFKMYATELERLGCIMDNTLVATILRLPDVVSGDKNDICNEEKAALLSIVKDALIQFDTFRLQEGKAIMSDILGRVNKIESLLSEIEPFEKRRTDVVKAKLNDAISQLKVEIDSNRLEQEMIFYFERLDITEETVRLKNHCVYFREVADTEIDTGRKLGFIAQEMGREINTLGSKANDSDIQRIVVQMKDELEKIKEQLLNVL